MNLVEANNLQVAVLKLWHKGFSAATITGVLSISEEALAEIVPESLWYDDELIQCRACNGFGFHTRTIPHKPVHHDQKSTTPSPEVWEDWGDGPRT